MVRYVGFADETEFGSPVTPPTDFLSAIRTDLHPERVEMEVQSMAILGNEDARVGTYKIVGDIELVPSSENVTKLLKWLMGGTPTPTQDPGEDRWKHVCYPSSSLKFGTVYVFPELGITPTDQAIQYTSCIPLELAIEAALDEPVSFSFSMLGQKDTKVDKTELGTLPTVRQLFSLDAIVEMPDASDISAKVDSLSLSITREVPDDYYAMTDHLLKGFLGGNFSVKGSLDLLFNDFDALELFWGGATGPVKSPTETSLQVDLVGPTLGGAGDYANHLIRLELPKIILPSASAPVEQMNKIIQTVPFTAFRGTIDAGTHVCRLTVANTLTEM